MDCLRLGHLVQMFKMPSCVSFPYGLLTYMNTLISKQSHFSLFIFGYEKKWNHFNCEVRTVVVKVVLPQITKESGLSIRDGGSIFFEKL